eukprot:7749786-Pyramimonas_sp.AAC.1
MMPDAMECLQTLRGADEAREGHAHCGDEIDEDRRAPLLCGAQLHPTFMGRTENLCYVQQEEATEIRGR